MVHVFAILTGREMRTALSTVEHVILDAQQSEVEISVQDLKHQTVNLVTLMPIAMSLENVYVT